MIIITVIICSEVCNKHKCIYAKTTCSIQDELSVLAKVYACGQNCQLYMTFLIEKSLHVKTHLYLYIFMQFATTVRVGEEMLVEDKDMKEL